MTIEQCQGDAEGLALEKEEGPQAQECSGLQGRGEESGLPESLQREPDILVPGI